MHNGSSILRPPIQPEKYGFKIEGGLKRRIFILGVNVFGLWKHKTRCTGGELRRPSEYTKGGLN